MCTLGLWFSNKQVSSSFGRPGGRGRGRPSGRGRVKARPSGPSPPPLSPPPFFGNVNALAFFHTRWLMTVTWIMLESGQTNKCMDMKNGQRVEKFQSSTCVCLLLFYRLRLTTGIMFSWLKMLIFILPISLPSIVNQMFCCWQPEWLNLNVDS